MIRLLLVRHGLTRWNEETRYLGYTDIPLNEIGKQQAFALAQEMHEEHFDQIYTSDLQRAFETAASVKANRELPLIPDSRLRELNFGAFEGLTFSEAKTKYPDMLTAWLENYDQPPNGGESFSSFSERVGSFLDDLKMIEGPKTYLIVCHGGTLREIVRILLGLSREAHWSFRFDPASLSEVHINGGCPTIVRINDAHHLNEV